MNSLQTVFERVANWNSKRYEQEYNHALAINLLREEYNEWRLDKEPVKKLDGLCDIVFVAAGVLWKAKVVERQNLYIENVFDFIDNIINNTAIEPGYFIGMNIDKLEVDTTYPVEEAVCHIILLAFAQASHMGLSQDQFMDALLVVCDSNDSKSIKKVAADIKANAGDKGPYFVAPEPRLQTILAKAKVF